MTGLYSVSPHVMPKNVFDDYSRYWWGLSDYISCLVISRRYLEKYSTRKSTGLYCSSLWFNYIGFVWLIQMIKLAQYYPNLIIFKSIKTDWLSASKQASRMISLACTAANQKIFRIHENKRTYDYQWSISYQRNNFSPNWRVSRPRPRLLPFSLNVEADTENSCLNFSLVLV